MRVLRPVVRSYTLPHLERAAAWVRAGGHAVVWIAARKARFVFPRPRKGDELDLGWWAVLDMGKSTYRVARRGPFEGMAFIAVPHDCYSIVRERAERDSIHADATRAIELDCLTCAACCKDNCVELEDQDVERFEQAGRGELLRPPYARRRDGRVTLILRKDACSTFPAGSECCLSSREEELGILDGAPYSTPS